MQWRRPEQPVDAATVKEQYPATRQQPICPSDGDEALHALRQSAAAAGSVMSAMADIKERRGGG